MFKCCGPPISAKLERYRCRRPAAAVPASRCCVTSCACASGVGNAEPDPVPFITCIKWRVFMLKCPGTPQGSQKAALQPLISSCAALSSRLFPMHLVRHARWAFEDDGVGCSRKICMRCSYICVSVPFDEGQRAVALGSGSVGSSSTLQRVRRLASGGTKLRYWCARLRRTDTWDICVCHRCDLRFAPPSFPIYRQRSRSPRRTSNFSTRGHAGSTNTSALSQRTLSSSAGELLSHTLGCVVVLILQRCCPSCYSRAVADFLNVLPRLVRSEASAAASQAGGSGSSAAREEEAVTNYRDTRGATGGAGGAGDGDVPAAGASSGRMRPFSRPSAVAETVARGAVARSLANNSASTTVLYSTFSVCPYCAIRSTRGLTWFPAKVVEYKAAVWLVTECPTHGPHESLYCSNVDFFKRITSFDEIIRNWNARMLRRGSDRARVGTRTPGSGTSALAPAPVAATPPPPTAHGEKEDESPNDESSSDRARASQTTRPAIPPRSPPSEVDTAGCPVPLPVELPLSEEAEKALADWAMDGPEASSVVEKYVGWNYWDDGGLPPSHPSHPSQRGRAAGTPAKGASVPLTPPIGAHGITAPSVVREEHKSHVAVPAPIADIEDLHSRLNFATPDPVTGAPANLPTILEFSVFENGAFKSNRDIERQFVTLTRRFPRGYSFVCRVNGSLGMDIAALNERVGFLIALVARRRCWCPVWVEVSAPRLVLLAKLEESVLRLSTVFPALQVFVGRGAEDAAVAELEELEEAMERFPEISILAMLSIDRPFPDLRRVMAWLRSRPQRFRLINLKLERSPTQLVTQLQRRAAARSSFATARAAAADVRSADTLADSTVDPFELLELLEEQTDGECIRRTLAAESAELTPRVEFVRANPTPGLCSTVIWTSTGATSAAAGVWPSFPPCVVVLCFRGGAAEQQQLPLRARQSAARHATTTTGAVASYFRARSEQRVRVRPRGPLRRCSVSHTHTTCYLCSCRQCHGCQEDSQGPAAMRR